MQLHGFVNPMESFLWTVITEVVDFVATSFFKGGLDFTSKNAMNNAWKQFDPTAPWSKTNHARKLDRNI